jgi:hypothetical protein
MDTEFSTDNLAFQEIFVAFIDANQLRGKGMTGELHIARSVKHLMIVNSQYGNARYQLEKFVA